MLAKSALLGDPSLAAFLQPLFDPADFLNTTLPPLQSSQKPLKNAASLVDLSSQTQSLLASLNAQAARLTNTLTQLTDEIIRSGSRLAYQVDVLRGEAQGLNESLTEQVADDIRIFAPESVPRDSDDDKIPSIDDLDQPNSSNLSTEPVAIERLRILLSVRDRLDNVIKLFGAALAWPPPPAPSGAASFISVSSTPTRDADAKAATWLSSQKVELSSLIVDGNDENARSKVTELKSLVEIWKGGSEERLRLGIISDLEKWIESEIRKRDGIDDPEDESQRAFLSGIYT